MMSNQLDIQQEAISQKEMVFSFRKGIQSLRKAGVLISCAWEVLGVRGICAKAPRSAQLSEPGVRERANKLKLSTHVSVITVNALRNVFTCDTSLWLCPRGGEMLPYIGYIGMSSVRGTCFFKTFCVLVRSRVSILVILVSRRRSYFSHHHR